MAWMGVPKSALRWEYKSQPFVYRSTVGNTGVCVAERMCCSSCGCNMTMQYYLYPEKTHVAASTIVENGFEKLRVGYHIFCKQAPDWYTIADDGVEKHDGFDEGTQAQIDEYVRKEQQGR